MQPLQAPGRAGSAGSVLKRRFFVALGWAWAAAIVWLSLTPAPPKLEFEHSDKLGHLLAYGVLMLWFCRLYAKTKTRLYYAAGFIAMGVGLEFIQGMLGYRSYEVFDMYANTLGVLLGWAAARMFPRVVARP